MKQITQTKNEISELTTFFPRVIREFEDHDEPMIYGGR